MKVRELVKRGTLGSILRQAGTGGIERTETVNGYAVIIEGERGSYSAYTPDLPGCVTAGQSVKEVERLMREAIALHIENLRLNGDPVPQPASAAAYVAKPAA